MPSSALGKLAVAAGFAVLSALASPAATPAPAAPSTVIALGTGVNANRLYQFTIGNPNGVSAPVTVSGIVPNTLVGIDHRPLDGVLYGVGVNGSGATVFTIDPTSGVATVAGSATVSTIAGATAYGVDFNPVVDRLRLVNNLASDGAGGNANNFRLTPTGTAIIDVDGDFSGLPGGNTNAPAIGVTHDRNVAGATATTTFAIASGGDRLLRMGGVDGVPSAGGGSYANLGSLGQDTSNSADIDIEGETGVAWAVLEIAGTSRLFTVDLTTGEATPAALNNRIGDGTVDFADVALPIQPALSAAGGAAAEGDAATITVTRTGSLGYASTVAFDTEQAGSTALANLDFPVASGTVSFAPGEATKSFALPTTEDTDFEPDETAVVRFHDPLDGTIPGPSTATVTITNDDTLPPPLPAPDKTAPATALAGVPSSIAFAKFLKGIKVALTPNEPAAFQVDLQSTVTKATLSAFNLTLASKALPIAAGARKVTLKPAKKLVGKPRKARKVRVRVVATDASGNAAVTTRTITVKAPAKKRKS